MKRFVSFGIVGSIGFIVDSSVLLFLVHMLDYNILFSRIVSFIVAVFVTWLLNRYFTFSATSINISKSKEYLKYLVIQTIGALINFCIFFILIYSYEPFKDILIIPLAIGSGFALIFNFTMIKNKVYKNT